MKTCSKCGETKPLEEFHKQAKSADGHVSHCKLCQKIIKKAYYEANKELVAAAVKAWREANKERKSAIDKAWREANKEQIAAAKKAWRESNPDKVKEYAVRKKEHWPEKVAARLAVSNAIIAGKLARQPCEICGTLSVEAHHDDYSNPLEVRWLCPKHHTEHHMTFLCDPKQNCASTSPPMLVVSDVWPLSRLMLHNRVSQIMRTL